MPPVCTLCNVHAGAGTVANYGGRDFRHRHKMSQSKGGRGLAGTSLQMSALVLEPWAGSYIKSATSSFSDFSFDDINWEGGSHEEDAIRLLKSIMEPAEIPERARRSRRHLERRVRREGEDGGAAKRPREVEEEVEVVEEEEEETGGDNPSNTSFYLPSLLPLDKVLPSTPFVPSGES